MNANESVADYGMRLEGLLQTCIDRGDISPISRNEMLRTKLWSGLSNEAKRAEITKLEMLAYSGNWINNHPIGRLTPKPPHHEIAYWRKKIQTLSEFSDLARSAAVIKFYIKYAFRGTTQFLWSWVVEQMAHKISDIYGGWFVPFRLFVISRWHNEGAITKRRKDESEKTKRRKDESEKTKRRKRKDAK